MRPPESDENGTLQPPANAFAPEFLGLAQPSAPLEPAPFKVEPVAPTAGRPGGFAVLKSSERLEDGAIPEAIFVQREHAVLCAALLPEIRRQPRYHIDEKPVASGPMPGGHPVTLLDGEQGPEVHGWVRHYQPSAARGLQLLENMLRSPRLLAAVAEAAGDGAATQLGRAIAEILAAQERNLAKGAGGQGPGTAGGEPG